MHFCSIEEQSLIEDLMLIEDLQLTVEVIR